MAPTWADSGLFEIIESYLEYQYTVYSLLSAQLITVQVYTAFNSSRTKENIT